MPDWMREEKGLSKNDALRIWEESEADLIRKAEEDEEECEKYWTYFSDQQYC